MGHSIKTCIGRCHDNYIPGTEFSIDDPRSRILSEGSLLSCDSSVCSLSTGYEPSVLSFKMIAKNSCIYLDGDVCKICLEEYDDEVRKPYILPCGHTFCILCLRALARRKRFKFIKCPIDRNNLYIRDRRSVKEGNKYQNFEDREITRATNRNTSTEQFRLEFSGDTFLSFSDSDISWYTDMWLRSQILKSAS